MPEETKMNRRSFLDRILRGGVALVGLFNAAFAIAYFRSGRGMRRKYERMHRVGELDYFDPGYSRVIRIDSDTVLVARTAEGKFFALSAVCPHKGCLVEWNKEENRMICPCHAALFDLRGNVLSGPAQKSLVSYTVDVVGTFIYLKV